MADGTEPIADDEILYRRVPIHYCCPETDPHPTPEAFRPRENDTTGLSFFRAKYESAEEVAENTREKSYYIAALRVGVLREHGMEVVPKPIPGHPGHAEISDLTYACRRDERSKNLMNLLAQRLCEIQGPLSPPKPEERP